MKIRTLTVAIVSAGIAVGLSFASVRTATSAQKSYAADAKPDAKLLDARDPLEQKIWSLLDDGKSVYVTLPESDFRSLGKGFALPDGGKTVTDLALNAPGGAFDPRDVAKIPAEKLGYKAD